MTKRLFAYIGLTMLITFSVVFYFGIYGAAGAVSSGLAVAVFGLFNKNLRDNRRVFALVSAVILLSTAYFYAYTSLKEIRTDKYNEKTVSFESRLTDTHKSYDYYYYELNCYEINFEKSDYKILLKTPTDLGARYGDIIYCEDVILEKMDNDYYLSKGYDFTAYSEDYYLSYTVTQSKDKGIDYIPVFIRDKLTYAVSVLIPGYSGELCNAVALGDKFGLSRDLYKDYHKTGLSYLIVVSGLHMSIIAAFVLLLTSKIKNRKLGRWLGISLVISFIILYIAVTGFSSSAVRSGIMIIILVIGRYLRWTNDSSNSLGLAALILTVFNPFSVGDAGMLMSFSSTAGILFISPEFRERFKLKFHIRIKNLWALREVSVNYIDKFRIEMKLWAYRILRTVYEAVTISFCAVAAISPITLMIYGVCNPFVFIYSVLVSPFISVLMYFTILSALLWYIPVIGILSYPAAFIAGAVASFINFVVKIISGLPFITFYNDPLYMEIWVIFTIAVFVLFLTYKASFRNVIAASLISFSVLIISLTAGYLYNFDKVQLKVLNSGGGNTVVFKSPGGLDVLSSGGKSSYYDNVSEKIHTITDKINLFVVQSSYESPDVKYAGGLLSEFDVDRVLLYYRYNTAERTYRLAKKCKRYNEFTENDGRLLTLYGSVEDKVLNINNHTWQYISDSKTSVLIAPYKGKSYEIPKSFYNPDYLILCNDIENIEKIKSKRIIWTSDKVCPKRLKKVSDISEDDYTIDFSGE